MRKTLLLFLLLLPIAMHGQTGFRIVEYNCENFFDCEHDSLKEDQMFLPQSPRRWTRHRFWQKLQAVSKVIVSMSHHGAPPDVVALTEVENDTVMTYLTRRALLGSLGYRYVMTRSPDPRGMNVALLYQTGTFRLLNSKSLSVDFGPLQEKPTRDVLYVSGKTYLGDTLHLFVCHFSSKLNGRKATEHYRCAEAQTVMHAIDSIRKTSPLCNLIVLGDFNETPREKAVKEVLHTQELDSLRINPACLYNMAENIKKSERIAGTYRYEGAWEMLDQMIVSGTLLNNTQQMHTQPSFFHIHAPKFLLQTDDVYSGEKPFRTYNGYRYQGGFSDHLPIFLDLVEKK